MADELRATVGVVHTAEPKANIPARVFNIDQTGDGAYAWTQEIGTSEEDVDTSAVGTEGLCYMLNLDGTNYVEFGKKDGSNAMQAIGRLGPSDGSGACPFALYGFNPGATLRMRANTAACKVYIVIWEA